VGRPGRAFLVVVAALAFAGAADAKPLLGVLGSQSSFQAASGQSSTVHLAFLGWGQGLSYGSPFVSLFGTLGPIPMIHLNTGGPNGKEMITPQQIAAGTGDAYLIGLNQAIAQWGKGIYIRPMAEMNNAGNLWSAFTASGAAKPGHSTADYKKAFARIYLVLHGGSAAAVSAKLKALGMPGVSQDLASNPFPRLRIIWNPLAGGSPRIAANSALSYYPGRAYVDVEGVDIYEEGLGDTAPWAATEAAYKAAVSHGRPFSIPEFGLFSVDDSSFVSHVCTFLKTHPRTEEASFYEGKPGGVFELGAKPKSKAVYRSCITPLGAAPPAWAGTSSQPGVSTTATITFSSAGRTVGSVSAPIGADELELDIVPASGVIAKGFWIRGGKSLGPMVVPAGATAASFSTASGGSAPTPIDRPRAGTEFHVKFTSSGTIASAWWTRVGKLLAQIPVASGETSIAMQQPGP
jgi:hypothetical protein